MDEFGRSHGVFHHFKGHVHHLAPIPVFMRRFEGSEIDSLNTGLLQVATRSLTKERREVPDVRHVNTLGSVPRLPDYTWAETHTTAVGVWHRVPVNQFLDLPDASVVQVRGLIEGAYTSALAATEPDAQVVPGITESWIQFYRDGDYKVLHNHERYGPPFIEHPWAGGYYVDDGAPDRTMPYSGVLSFRVRNVNYFSSVPQRDC